MRILFTVLTLILTTNSFSQINPTDSLIKSISNHIIMIDSLIKCCEKDSFNIFHVDYFNAYSSYYYSIKNQEKRVLNKSTLFEKNTVTNFLEYSIDEKIVALKVNRVKYVVSLKKIVNKNLNYIKWWFSKFSSNPDPMIKPSKKQSSRIEKQSIEATIYFNNNQIIYYKDNQKIKNIKKFKKKILKQHIK